jgi:hypothetical protein
MDAAEPMTLRDVADLLFAARERIDFYWNFYVIVVVAVIGWLVSLKKTLAVPVKVLVSVAFVIAAAMNLVGLYSSYTFAEALRTDLLRISAATPLTDTRQLLEQHSYLPQRTIAFGVHFVIGAMVIFTVWFARLVGPEAAVAKTAATQAEKAS